MRIHLIGVCGAGMAPLAGLLKAAGHEVSGSDCRFEPPVSDFIAKLDLKTYLGFHPENLSRDLDLVIIGNVCRVTNPEAQAAIQQGYPYDSMPGVIEKLILQQTKNIVVAGTHGKTTTTALIAWMLQSCGQQPGFLIGGQPQNFNTGFRLGQENGYFVIEGDEYDSAFFEKSAKFLRYRPLAVLVTSMEQDHLDIYPTLDSYEAAFIELVRKVPSDGLLVLNAANRARSLAAHANCRVVLYGVDGEEFEDSLPTWLACPVKPDAHGHPFDLFVGGSAAGRAWSPLFGKHFISNALGAITLLAEQQICTLPQLLGALSGFLGVDKRQQLLGVANEVSIYVDFAHHPTAVQQTLHALRLKHPHAKIFACFEPKSATACSNFHQDAYTHAFEYADEVWLAPVVRKNLEEDRKLDTKRICERLLRQGKSAYAAQSYAEILQSLSARTKPGDVVVFMSNGSFGDVQHKLLAILATRRLSSENMNKALSINDL